jgi:hypothetical protein
MGPVEDDGVDYRGIVWFLVIMAVTIVGSMVLMFGAFTWFEYEIARTDRARPPLARPQGQLPPGPNLLRLESGAPQTNEPGNYEAFRAREEALLHGYAHDAAAGTARIPIDRAKELLLERGLPARPAGAGTTATAPEAADAAETPGVLER